MLKELRCFVPFWPISTDACIDAPAQVNLAEFYLLRLYLHEDGSVEPSGRDAHLQPPRCDRSPEQPAVLHDSYRGSEEEHDHWSDRQVTGEPLVLTTSKIKLAQHMFLCFSTWIWDIFQLIAALKCQLPLFFNRKCKLCKYAYIALHILILYTHKMYIEIKMKNQKKHTK